MKVYHYHPSGLIFLEGDFHINYMETPENFTLDYGQAGYIPTNPYNEIIYDLDDVTNRFLINESTGLKDLIASPILEIENIINAYDSLITSQELRNNPPFTVEQTKEQKIYDIKTEGLIRMQTKLPGIESFNQLEIIREQWLSTDVAARSPTVNFQYLIDVWIAGKAAIVTINSLSTITEVQAYDVVVSPTWPV